VGAVGENQRVGKKGGVCQISLRMRAKQKGVNPSDLEF